MSLKKTGTQSAQRAVNSMLSRMLPYTPPWALAGAAYGAANGAHWAWANDPGPALAAGVVSAILTWATSKMAPNSDVLWRAHSTATTGLVTGGITVSSAIDPTTPGALSAWVLLGAATAGSWNIRALMRNGGNADARALPTGNDLGALVNRLKGVKAIEPRVEGEALTTTLVLPPGEYTASDVQAARPYIASALAVPESGVRVVPDPKRADRVELTIVAGQPLEGVVDWPGPSRMGACITQPLRHGLYEDGLPAELWLPGQHGGQGVKSRPAAHGMVSGMTGAGKGETTINLVTEVATRQRVIQWAGDPSKGVQTFMDVADAFDWFAIGKRDVKAMIAALPRVITARANQLGAWGYKQWTPEAYDKHGMPYLVVWVEEASKILGGNKAWVEAAQEARSAGVSLMMSSQVFDHTTIVRKSRGQFGIQLIHGQGEDIDASYVVPEELEAAGGDPVRWQNNEPGMHYLVAPGVDKARLAVPARSYLTDPAKVRRAIASFKGLRAKADPVTAEAAGAVYARRHDALAEAKAALSKGALETFTDAPGADDNDGQEAVMHDDIDIDAPLSDAPGLEPDAGTPEPDGDRVVPYVPPADTEDLGDIDTDAEITGDDTVRMRFGPEPRPFQQPMPREDAVRLLDTALATLRAQGRDQFAPADLRDVYQTAGKKRTWLVGEINRLIEEGHLVRLSDKGIYGWTDGADTAKELVGAS